MTSLVPLAVPSSQASRRNPSLGPRARAERREHTPNVPLSRAPLAFSIFDFEPWSVEATACRRCGGAQGADHDGQRGSCHRPPRDESTARHPCSPSSSDTVTPSHASQKISKISMLGTCHGTCSSRTLEHRLSGRDPGAALRAPSRAARDGSPRSGGDAGVHGLGVRSRTAGRQGLEERLREICNSTFNRQHGLRPA